MIKYLIFIFLASSHPLLAESYRTFTNASGQTIKAKIVAVDTDAHTVTLEKTNRRKSTVSISIFCKADQAYILSAQETKEPDPPQSAQKKLTEDEVKAIAQRYVEGWNEQDFKLLADQFLFLKKGIKPYYDLRIARLKKVQVEDIYERAFTAELKMEGGYAPILWCFLTTDGKIKYDSCLRPHPLTRACSVLDFLLIHGVSNEAQQKSYLKQMKPTGIPTFGLTAGCKRNEAIRSLKQTIEWMEKNGETYDNSEPKVFFTPEAYKNLKKRLKGLSNRI